MSGEGAKVSRDSSRAYRSYSQREECDRFTVNEPISISYLFCFAAPGGCRLPDRISRNPAKGAKGERVCTGSSGCLRRGMGGET